MHKGLVQIAFGAALSAAAAVALHAAREVRADSESQAPRGGETLRNHAEKVASYTLDVRLDATTHRLSGRGQIVWKNATRAPAKELYFHLYMNAFKNDRSLFLRSPFGAGRSGDRASEWGYIDVKKLQAREHPGVDLWSQAARHSPSDPEDETNIVVPLPRPVEPGETLNLDVEFEVQLPEIVERTGYKDGFHFVAQWFPKIARRERDGSWAEFAFHPQSEFAADFGDYDVTMDVPAGMHVGATGSQVESAESGARKRVRYKAESVHDFAWTAWDGFQERRERVAGVEVRVLYPPGHAANAELELETVRFSLPHFNRRYGRYPYPTLTLVHPPEKASNAGGMEYPTLITTGGPWFAAHSGVHGIEAVTVHELGHQWFYGLVATNEHDHPFLDEGLNSFAEYDALKARYGESSLVSFFGLKVSSAAVSRVFSAARGEDEAVASKAPEFASFRNLAALVYSRTATIMTTFGRVYGEQRLLEALGAYTRRYRFEHPGPAEFLDVMRGYLGPFATKQLEIALFERGTIDYVVRDLQTAPAEPPSGVFDRVSGRETKKREPGRPPSSWLGRVVVYRHGNLRLPVDVELIDENGTRERRRWDGHGHAQAFEYRGSARLVAVVVDPDRRVLLDSDLLNNATATKPRAPDRVFERALYVSGLVLHAVGP